MLKPLVLTSDLVSFCQSGLSIIVASCEADGCPIGGPALACTIDTRNQTVRLVLPRKPNGPLLQAIAQGKGIAATFTLPSTHRSIQLKGPSAKICPLRADDKRHAADQSAGFVRELITIGYPEVFAQALCGYDARDLAALSFTPTQAFQQTPGPDAGSALQ